MRLCEQHRLGGILASRHDQCVGCVLDSMTATLSDARAIIDTLNANIQGQTEAGVRQARMAKVCGDKRFVLCIRPAGEPGWLYCSDLDSVVDMLVEGEPGDEWEMKWTLMTQAEVDAMPEHPGW